MSCNSCSNITLPGSAGVAGPTGAAGASVSVLDVDFTLYNGSVSAYPVTPQKTVIIPAHTWENEHDMLELEMMFQCRGKVYSGIEPRLMIKVDGQALELYTPNANNQLDFYTDLGMSYSDNNIVKVRLQLPMFVKTGNAGRMRPVIETDVFTGTNGGSEYYSLADSAKSIYGRSLQLLVVGDITADVNMDVFMMHDAPGLPFAMVYYKLLSYKKIV